MYTIFGNSNVELCKEVGKIDTPKNRLKSTIEKKSIYADGENRTRNPSVINRVL